MSDDVRSFTGLDFAVGSLRGVRTFRYLSENTKWLAGPRGQLIGLYYPQPWVEGVNVAQCRKQDSAFGYDYRKFNIGAWHNVDVKEAITPDTFDPVPRDGEHMLLCHCGFYGYYDGSNDYYSETKHGGDLISGVIEGWGEVMVGSRGFRCTHAKIVALHIPDPDIQDLIYPQYPSVPMFSSFNAMVAAYPEDDGGARENA